MCLVEGVITQHNQSIQHQQTMMVVKLEVILGWSHNLQTRQIVGIFTVFRLGTHFNMLIHSFVRSSFHLSLYSFVCKFVSAFF